MKSARDPQPKRGFVARLASLARFAKQVRPVLSLWPYFCRQALFPILVVTGLFLLPEFAWPADALVFGLLLVPFFIRCWRQCWLWRLGWAVRKFHTQSG